MKSMNTALTGLVFAGLLCLLTLGCAKEKTMQPMDTKMETMHKEPMQTGMGGMEKPDPQQDMGGSMQKKKTM